MDIDIQHVAKLAKLTLSPEEEQMMREQLPQILDYVSKLQEVDTSGIDAKAYLSDVENVFRKDEAVQVVGEQHDALMQAFPKKVGESLQVPGVFE